MEDNSKDTMKRVTASLEDAKISDIHHHRSSLIRVRELPTSIRCVMLICAPAPTQYYVVKPVEKRALFYPGHYSTLGGLGLFASTQIQRGTRIISDIALAELPKKRKPSLVIEANEALTPNQKVVFNSLPYYHKTDPQSVSIYPTANPIHSVKVVGIFLYNLITMTEMVDGGGDQKPIQKGLFPRYANIQHSCVANVYVSYNPIMRRLNVHAVRDIKEGEPITLCFRPFPEDLYEIRAFNLENFGIRCTCSICVFPGCTTSDANQEKMKAMKNLIWDQGMFERPGYAMTLIPIYQELLQKEQLTHILARSPQVPCLVGTLGHSLTHATVMHELLFTFSNIVNGNRPNNRRRISTWARTNYPGAREDWRRRARFPDDGCYKWEAH